MIFGIDYDTFNLLAIEHAITDTANVFIPQGGVLKPVQVAPYENIMYIGEYRRLLNNRLQTLPAYLYVHGEIPTDEIMQNPNYGWNFFMSIATYKGIPVLVFELKAISPRYAKDSNRVNIIFDSSTTQKDTIHYASRPTQTTQYALNAYSYANSMLPNTRYVFHNSFMCDYDIANKKDTHDNMLTVTLLDRAYPIYQVRGIYTTKQFKDNEFHNGIQTKIPQELLQKCKITAYSGKTGNILTKVAQDNLYNLSPIF